MEIRHFNEEIQDLLDDRLDAVAKLELESHLASCIECRRELDALSWVKQVSNRYYAAETVPAKVEENILTGLDREDRNSSLGHYAKVSSWSWLTRQRVIPAFGILLFAIAALMLTYITFRPPFDNPREIASAAAKITESSLPANSGVASEPVTPAKLEPSKRPPGSNSKPKSRIRPNSLTRRNSLSPSSSLSKSRLVSSEVIQHYRSYKAGELLLTLNTDAVNELEKSFIDEGLPFETRVFDFGMMGYNLVGGRVHRLLNRQSALYVYKGKGEKILVCQMYRGRVKELPAGELRRENNGIKFYIYRRKGITTVFWQEGSVICALTSDIATDEIVQLAFAKAMKV